MIVWAAAAGAAVLVGLLMIWGGRVPAALRPYAAATLMLGLAAYVLQGRADLPSAPVPPPASADADADFGQPLAIDNGQMADRFGPAGKWLGLADRMTKNGKTADAAATLQAGLKQNPGNVDLLVALGNVLVAHGGGAVTGAAALAFDRAAAADPAHPAPPFFSGLALAQAGDLAGADRVWRGLLARSPADAPWRADLEARLAGLQVDLGAAPPAAR